MGEVYGEETIPIPVGLGIDSYNHPANLEDGFCTSITNMIADGTSLKTRKGFQPPDSVDTREAHNTIGLNSWYGRIPNVSDATWPVAWYTTDGTSTYLIRQFDRDDPSGTDTNPQIAEFSGLGNVVGMCAYLGRLYVNEAGSIKYLTSFDWSAGTVTETAAASSPGVTTRGLFVFKDRMWCWDDTKIYFTDVPTSPGGYPEAWGSNFIVIGAHEGLGKIWNIVPVGTNLYVFTGSGLYSIAVIGTPTNWVIRSIDKTVRVNHQNSVLEHQGYIYFVDVEGVKVTNGGEVKTISDSIRDVFEIQVANHYFFWKLVPFEDGMIVCRQSVTIAGSYPSAANYKDITYTKLYYTDFENINWTEFTFNTTTKPSDLLGGWSRLEIHKSWQPNSYIALGHNNTTDSNHTSQLLKYTGYQDKLRRLSQTEETAAVTGSFTTKVVRGQMFWSKRAKYAYLNFSANGTTSDAYNLSYNWDTEALTATSSGTIDHNLVSPLEALTKIKADFIWRHCRLNVTFTLDANHTEYSFLGAGITNETERKEPRRAS